jgi:hypothetical protein
MAKGKRLWHDVIELSACQWLLGHSAENFNMPYVVPFSIIIIKYKATSIHYYDSMQSCLN